MVSFATSPDAFAPPVSLHATPKQDAEEDKNLGLNNETEDDTEDTDEEPPREPKEENIDDEHGPLLKRRRAAMAMEAAAGDDMSNTLGSRKISEAKERGKSEGERL